MKMRGPLSQAGSRPMVRRPPNRPAAPILTQVDSDVASTGDALRQAVGRAASRGRSARVAPRVAPTVRQPVRMPGRVMGPSQRYADGGKVASALSGIRTLARQLKQALDRDDKETAGRLIRQMEKLEPGSSKSLTADPSAKARGDKLATFAKGGKVKAVNKQAEKLLAILRSLDLDPKEFDLIDRKGKLRIQEAKEVIEDAIEGEREVDDFVESMGTEDPEELTQKIKSKVARKPK